MSDIDDIVEMETFLRTFMLSMYPRKRTNQLSVPSRSNFAAFLVYGLLPVMHTIISKTCYLTVPFYLSDEIVSKDWQVSKVTVLLLAFSANNLLDTASAYMNMGLTCVSLHAQHCAMIFIGLVAGFLFILVDSYEKPLLMIALATGLAGFAKGNNILDVYVRMLVPTDITKQSNYANHIAKAIPCGYFIGYTVAGFIYQQIGMVGYGYFIVISSMVCLCSLAFLRPFVQTIGSELHSEDTEEGFENGTHVTWTTTMKAIMITRFISAAGDEMYYLIGPIIMYDFVNSGQFGLICGFAHLYTIAITHFAHDPLFEKEYLHYPYLQLFISCFTIVAFLGLRFTTSTIVACICQFYWAFSHIFVRTSVNTERSAMTMNLDMKKVSSTSNIIETLGFILASSVGMLLIEEVGFYNGLYASALIYVFNNVITVLMYRWKMFTIKKTIDIAAHAQVHDALQNLGTSSAETGDCELTHLHSLAFLSDIEDGNFDRKRRPVAMHERLLAHVLSNLREELEASLEKSVSLFHSWTDSNHDSITNTKDTIMTTDSITEKLSTQKMVELLMKNQALLDQFFEDNVTLQYEAIASIREEDENWGLEIPLPTAAEMKREQTADRSLLGSALVE